jgi:two-component system LytT family sensor kinase
MRYVKQSTDDAHARFGRDARVVIVALVFTCAALDLVHSYFANHLESLDVPWNFRLYQTAIFWLTYLPLVPLSFFLADRFPIDRSDRRTIAIHIAAALVFAYLHTICFASLDPLRLYPSGSLLRRTFRTVRINFPIDLISYWAIVGISCAFYYRSESQERGLESARLETAAAQLQHSLTEARLRALQAQLNPHFLFNTLNAISVLARKGETSAVVEAVARLSRLLRICLDDKRPQQIPLSDELGFLDVYLDIQRLSLGDRLTVRQNIADDVLDAAVPSMILQPLVENAIIHGVAGHSGAGTIRVEARHENGTLCVSVTDTGRGFRARPVAGGGIGLANTEARLQQIYGSAQQIAHHNESNGGATVTIVIPFSRSTAFLHA